MPHMVKPMLAKIKDKPFDGEDWIFEIKWDGYRAVSEVKRGDVALYSRNQLSFNAKYPSVVDALEHLNINAIFDGEVVAFDEEGKPSFQTLQLYDPDKNRLEYHIFDLIYLEGYLLTDLPLIQRKELLKSILPPHDPVLIYSDHIEKEGVLLFEEMKKKELEGMIAKEKSSIYQFSKRSSDWLKIKTQLSQETVICGFTAPRGSRKDLGALILGVYKDGKLTYVGHSGGGFNTKMLSDIRKKLEPLITDASPFDKKIKTNAPVTWVKPKLVCQVSFSEWTKEGNMRHPIFQGMRIDKKPAEVIKEDASTQNESPADLFPEILIGKEEAKASVVVDKHRLVFTNVNKLYWPDEGYTKGDLLNYYHNISPYILPYLKDRPESLNRHPNGIKGPNFFHKDAGGEAPSWMKKAKVRSESEDKYINYVICQDEASLLYLNNLGCIEINPWNSRAKSKDRPDYMVIDLDPAENTFDEVVETALAVKEVLDQAGAKGYCKTSGASGLHIYIPLGAQYTYDEAKEFGRILAIMTQQLVPDFTTVERNVKARGNKIYIDFLQNRKGQTLAAAYSVRPKPGATVSTPLRWEEVKAGLHPSQFTIKNIFHRLEKNGDLFKPVLGKGIDIYKCLDRLKA